MRGEDEEEDFEEERKTPARSELKSPNATKPPRPSAAASLDRRQRSRSQSHRRERDSKSRSTHSLRNEKDLNEKIMIANNLAKDNQSSSSCSNRRISPIAFEVPAPPPFHPWEMHYYKHHMTSREDLRSMDYYRRPCDPYRIGSCQELYHHPSNLSLAGNNYDNYYHYPPPPPCCANSYYPGSSSTPYQVDFYIFFGTEFFF
jgi:hypothetical protein